MCSKKTDMGCGSSTQEAAPKCNLPSKGATQHLPAGPATELPQATEGGGAAGPASAEVSLEVAAAAPPPPINADAPSSPPTAQ